MKSDSLIDKIAEVPFFRIPKRTKFMSNIDFFYNKTGKMELYNIDPLTKKYEQLSDGEFTGTWRVRGRDGSKSYTSIDEGGNEHYAIYEFNLKTKELTQLTSPPTFHEGPLDISPDGKYLLFNSSRTGQPNLFKMDLTTKIIKQLTDHKNPFHGYALWAYSDWIYYQANETDNRRNSDIWGVKEDGSDNRLIYSYSTNSRESIIDISNNGKSLLLSIEGNDARQVAILNVETKQIQFISDGTYDERPMEFSNDSKKVLTIRFKEIKRIPVIYDLETKEEKVLKIRGTVLSAVFCLDDDFVIYSRSDPKTPWCLAKYNLTNDEEEIIIQPKLDIQTDFIDGEYIKYPSFDGLEIPAIIYKPHLTIGQKSPAVIHVPGGPGGQFSLLFEPFSQIFAQRGFVVLCPTVRGSIGFGKDYFEKNIMDLGGGDAQDVVFGKKFLESLNFVDCNRIGVFGGSYGGYMTYLLLTKYADSNWQGGAAWIGITHWKTMYDKSSPSYQHFLEGLIGKYEENKELWEDRSPLNHVKNIQAPILMIQGVNDPRCPIEESRQFRDKLLELGKQEGNDYEYHELGVQGHGSREIMQFKDIVKTHLAFFEKRLM